MKLGVLVHLGTDAYKTISQVADLGLDNCQLACWNLERLTDENAEIIANAAKKCGVEISAFWCGWSGPAVWDYYSGPLTLGIVPEPYRETRCKEIKAGADFALKIGVRDVITHLGFLPEHPLSPEYPPILAAVKDLALYMKKNGQRFLFETGQETPTTLKRLIVDAATGNMGINLDPANLITYGKANPTDALDIFGEYVMGVHAKDGNYSTIPSKFGKEARIGEGRVDFSAIFSKLRSLGYNGPITIEREISGEQQRLDILNSIDYLGKILGGITK